VSIELLPAEKIALEICVRRINDREELLPNTALMCVLALARVAGLHDWTQQSSDEHEK